MHPGFCRVGRNHSRQAVSPVTVGFGIGKTPRVGSNLPDLPSPEDWGCLPTADGCVRLRSSVVKRDKSDFQGIADQAGDVMNIQAVHQLRTVCFNRFDTDLQGPGDFFRGMSLGN